MIRRALEAGKGKMLPDTRSIGLLAATVIVSMSSYAYTYTRGYRWGEAFGAREQKLDLYLLIALLIVSPALATFGTVFYKAVKGNFPTVIFGVFLRAQILLLPLFAHNYTGLWVPFIVISLTMVVFYSVKLKKPAMLAAVKSVGEYLLEHRLVFYIVLVATAHLPMFRQHLWQVLSN